MTVRELVSNFGHFYPFRIDTLSKIMPFDQAFELHSKATGWCYGPKKKNKKKRKAPTKVFDSASAEQKLKDSNLANFVNYANKEENVEMKSEPLTQTSTLELNGLDFGEIIPNV